MSEGLSRLLEEERSKNDHTEGDPLDGVEEGSEGIVFELGLTEEGDEELSKAREEEGKGSCVLFSAAEAEARRDGDESCCKCDVERNRVKSEGSARNIGHRPWEGAGKAGVAAFGEVTEGEEGPGECRAGSPGVECR